MMPVSDVTRPLAEALKALRTPQIQKPEEEAQSRPLKPVMDEYIPGKRMPSGLYRMGKDEDGRPKICFDSLEHKEGVPENPEAVPNLQTPEEEAPNAENPRQDKKAKGPEEEGKKEERCIANTDKVDREIEKLRKKQQELEQRLGSEADESKIKNLKSQLNQVERELSRKDNDTYRRQHTQFS